MSRPSVDPSWKWGTLCHPEAPSGPKEHPSSQKDQLRVFHHLNSEFQGQEQEWEDLALIPDPSAVSPQELPNPAQIPQGQGACCPCGFRIMSSPSTFQKPAPSLVPWSLPGRCLQRFGDRAILHLPCQCESGEAVGPCWLLSGGHATLG